MRLAVPRGTRAGHYAGSSKLPTAYCFLPTVIPAYCFLHPVKISKSEYRPPKVLRIRPRFLAEHSKQIQNSNDLMSQTLFVIFKFRSFNIVSYLEFRVSNFLLHTAYFPSPLVPRLR